MVNTFTADVETETSSCCGARVSYSGEGDLYCKKCYVALQWSTK